MLETIAIWSDIIAAVSSVAGLTSLIVLTVSIVKIQHSIRRIAMELDQNIGGSLFGNEDPPDYRGIERPSTSEEILDRDLDADRLDGIVASEGFGEVAGDVVVESDRIVRKATRSKEGPSPDPRIVDLLFATNRESDEENRDTFFTGERADKLVYGSATVRVPENHRLGKIEQPFQLTIFSFPIWRQERRSEQHFVLNRVALLGPLEWQDTINSSGATDAFVFVHGFNTSFTEALFRCAQIAWDLKLRSLPVVFSWPSRGRVVDYLYDRESAMAARQPFLEFLQSLTEDTGIERVHILSHSMGNQVVLEALAHHPHQLQPLKISELMMAAPDVDANVYRNLVARIAQSVRGMTLYASSVDRALAASRSIAGNMPRAGDVLATGPVLVEGVDAIDVTGLGADILGLNHGVFAQNRSILNDVSIVMKTGERPPHNRLADIRCVPEGDTDPRYWKYAP